MLPRARYGIWPTSTLYPVARITWSTRSLCPTSSATSRSPPGSSVQVIIRERWKHVREFGWDLLEIPEARRDEQVSGGDRLLVVQRRRKSVVDMLEAMHESGKRLKGLLLLEPRGVA